MDCRSIGSELRSLRVKKRKPIKEVCKDLGINTSTLYKYERDASDMQLETLKKVLEYYNTDLIIFFKIIGEYNHK